MSDLKSVRLEDVLLPNGVSYGIVQPGQHISDGVPIVRVADLYGNLVRTSEPLRVAASIGSLHSRTRLTGDEVLISIVGTVGRVALANPAVVGWNVARVVAVLRPRNTDDAQWLRYALLSPAAQAQMQTRKTDTVQATLNLSDLRQLRIPWPEVSQRMRIAAVLGALDDLIDTDRAQIGRLEDLARSIAATASQTVGLSSIARPMVTAQVAASGSVQHYSLPAFDDGAAPEQVDGARIQSSKLVLHGPCVLVSRLNPKWERCWMAYPGSNAVASTEFVPLVGLDVEPEHVWAVTSAPEFWEQMRSRVTGTTGSHQRVDKHGLLALKVPDVRLLPPTSRTTLTHLVRSAQAARDEISQLASARDQLVPLLMSGKVRVSESIEVA